MEWQAPAIVLEARPYNEGDAVATVLTEAHGLHRGLVRGGSSRGQTAIWLAGNMVQVRWTARLADQLGGFTGELIHAGAAQVMDDPLGLAMLSSCCALAEDALPEREPHPRTFGALLQLIPRLTLGAPELTAVVRWEVLLLADLGYGLDLTRCAVTGQQDGLVLVSPRTGRAVTREAAGIWAERLLPLPAFLLRDAPVDTFVDAAAWRDGLRLTGHFLFRDVFGHRHRPLPYARRRLYDRVANMADSEQKDNRTDDA